ncbi:MAG: flagellar hook protein FlgE [Legionellales bacterium]
MAGIGVIATSGMNAAMTNMQEISNNIANTNTIGFKKASVNFADICSQSNGGNLSQGLGVNVTSIKQDFSAGQLETTNSGLDLSLNNSGFFIQRDPVAGTSSYTRAGRFTLDNNGYILGLGGRIQGFSAVNGVMSTTGQLADLQIPQKQAPALPTTLASQTFNLDSSSTVPVNAFSQTDPTSYNYRVDSTVYDSLGAPNALTVFYVNTGPNAWDAQVAVNGTSLGAPGNVTFNSDGSLGTVTGLGALAWNPVGGAASPQSLQVDVTGATQFSNANQIMSNSANGCPSGLPTGFNIDNNGQINVYYSNGQTQIQGQLAVANFAAPQNLGRGDSMSWTPTSLSGAAIVNMSSSANAFNSGSVELSNVDLTEELVSLLSSQHDFQANAQVEQTYNQVLQTIEQL